MLHLWTCHSYGIKENEERKGDLQRHINNFMNGFAKSIAVLSISLPKIYRWLSLFIAFKQVIGILTASKMLRRIVEKHHQEIDSNRPTNHDMLKWYLKLSIKRRLAIVTLYNIVLRF